MPQDFFLSSSVTSAAVPGFVSAIVSGVGSGVSQSITAAKNAALVLSENSGQRDSLLKSLHILFDDAPEFDHSVLETYINDLKDGLIATNDFFAYIFRNLLLSGASSSTHLSQLPLDIVTALTHMDKALKQSEDPRDKIKNASKQAFTIDVRDSNSSVSVRKVMEEVSEKQSNISAKIDGEMLRDNNSHALTHARIVSIGVNSSVSMSAIIPSLIALIVDSTGQGVKEAAATHYFSKEDSNKENKNVYVASSAVSKASKESDCQASKLQSKELEAALSDMHHVAQISSIGVTSPLTTVLLRLIVSALFVESSRGINSITMATVEGRIRKALADATAQGPSAGVDRINSLHSNLSSLSNIMRLCAQNLHGATAVKTAAQSSEVVSSRSISIMLSHVNKLAEALRQLIVPDQADRENRSRISIASDSSVALAKENVLGKLDVTIKEVLDRIEQENGQHVIPGLNQDMANSLASSSHSSVTSLITTHSFFINPIVIASKGIKRGTQINEAQKNEALMATLPALTRALNAIQACTRNMMDEMKEVIHINSSYNNENSLLSTHEFSASGTATVYKAASAMSLLCDEMLSICRSLSLVDRERLKAATQKINEVPSKEESAQTAAQISWDSHSQQNNSALHAIAGLRLTLSHTGAALINIALELHKALADNMDTIQQNVAMHTLQKSLLHCSAYSARYLAEGLLLSTGGVSALPISFNGSANSSRNKIHTTDANLHPMQTHECEHSSKNGSSESLQATGFSTDQVAGTVANVLKVLAKTGLIGLDTTLRLIKLLEIISLHRDSHVALHLESNDSSAPNGLSKNNSVVPGVGSTVGTEAVFINMLAALQSSDKTLQTQSTLTIQDKLINVIDKQIEVYVAILKDDKKGLKAFYKIIIKLLYDCEEGACNRLVERLHLGGISLSNYHSKFGAYEQVQETDLLTEKFANADDAQGVLRKFIDEAKGNYALLKSLHESLPEAQRTKKSQALYHHVFMEVYQRYQQVKMRDMGLHGSNKRKLPTMDTFQIDIGLIQEQSNENINGASASLRV